MHSKIQKMKTAFDLFGDVLRMIPIDPSAWSRMLQPHAHSKIDAETQRKFDGDAAEILRKLSEAISLYEDDRFYIILGFVLSDYFGLSNQAEVAFQKAISINPVCKDIVQKIKTLDPLSLHNEKQFKKLLHENEEKRKDVVSAREIKRKTIKLSELNSILSMLGAGWDGIGNLERITKELGFEKHILFHSFPFSNDDKDPFVAEYVMGSPFLGNNKRVLEIRNLDIEENGKLTLTRGGMCDFHGLDFKVLGHNYLLLNNRFKGDDVSINYWPAYPTIFYANEFSGRLIFRGTFSQFDPFRGVRIAKKYLNLQGPPSRYNLIFFDNSFKNCSFMDHGIATFSDGESGDEEVICPSALHIILYKNKVAEKIELSNLSDAKFKGNLINEMFLTEKADIDTEISFFGENKIRYLDIDSSLVESPQCEFQFHIRDIFDEELNNAKHHKKLFLKLKKKAEESGDSQQAGIIDAQFLSHFEIAIGGWSIDGNQSASKADQDVFSDLFASVQVRLKELGKSATVGLKMEKTSEAMCEFFTSRTL